MFSLSQIYLHQLPTRRAMQCQALHRGGPMCAGLRAEVSPRQGPGSSPPMALGCPVLFQAVWFLPRISSSVPSLLQEGSWPGSGRVPWRHRLCREPQSLVLAKGLNLPSEDSSTPSASCPSFALLISQTQPLHLLALPSTFSDPISDLRSYKA